MSDKGESKIDCAVRYATIAHRGQVRKGTMRPYIVHPVEVADIVTAMTSDEDVICAALLHDTVEDCETVSLEDIETLFGNRVASIVNHETEDKTKSWAERKGNTIEQLKTAPIEVQIVALCDKLSNMRDINRDYPRVGDELWNRFRMKDKRIIGWYYKGVQESLYKALGNTEAFKEYQTLVEKHFG